MSKVLSALAFAAIILGLSWAKADTTYIDVKADKVVSQGDAVRAMMQDPTKPFKKCTDVELDEKHMKIKTKPRD